MQNNNGGNGLLGPGGVPLNVPDLSPKTYSFECNKCGFSPPDVQNPQFGTVPSESNFSMIAGEQEPHFGCLRCWIKFQRSKMGQMVMKEKLHANKDSKP